MIHKKAPGLESFFNNVASLQTSNFIKKRLQHSCFPMNIAKFLRTPTSKKSANDTGQNTQGLNKPYHFKFLKAGLLRIYLV